MSPARSVHSAEEFMTLVGAGLQLRARQATAVHSDSSRSHLVVTATLTRAASPHSTGEWHLRPARGP